jgi:small neutral amino acid transporter SnatA (MarC family)
MNLQVLPLAITMVIGPVLMAAIVLLTNERPLQVSLAYLLGIAVAAVAGTALALGVASLLGDSVSLGNTSDTGATGTIIQLALVAVLVVASVLNYVRRSRVKPPKWIGSMMEAGPRKAFTTGVVVVLVGPSDVAAMIAVGTNLEQNESDVVAALPFVAATVLLAALPLLAFLLFHPRAIRLMPRVRDWMDPNAWLINVVVYCFFILLLLA